MRREAKGEEEKSCGIWRSQVWRKAPARPGGGRVCRGEGCHSQPQEPPSAAAASVQTTAGRSSKGFQADPTARRGEVLPLFTAHVRTELL